ncbi:DUF2341 domain-containing protein [Thermococcus pacificus]|uniref:DUF2341 domain-containing protein n=1 Tax=Thermococcus pacificus TaxID=71998 RepID=A0A218P6K7_9EURY|nr:DUF2341 domain-containing protein [Thermococcus pacificus]ASJ06426.1 hypothetical protein A3L08_03305 [Thermococcus pacificus]
MKRRGFLINSAVLLLLIPLLLLIATYEDASSMIITSQSENVQIERTFRLTSYLEEDFKNTLSLSTKRAIALSVDYVTSERPLDNASAALKQLITYGHYPYIGGTNSEWKSREEFFMKNNTIKDWLRNMEWELERQGYTMKPSPDEIVQNMKLTVAPLDSFHIVVNASIPNIIIEDSSGLVVYNSSIPQKGSVYVVIPIEGIEDPLFPHLTSGRTSRIISACKFAYPSITPPYTRLDGYGHSSIKTFSGQLYNVPRGGTIFYSDKYTAGENVLGYITRQQPSETPNAPYIFNTTLGGRKVSPLSVFNPGDIGVMTFDSISGGTGTPSHWCEKKLEYRANMTLPSTAPPNSLVLLELTPSSVPFGSAVHDGSAASIRIYKRSDTSCEIAPYWIEYWGDDKILIWLNTTDTREYTVYYSTSDQSMEWSGNIAIFPVHNQSVALTAGEEESKLVSTVPWDSFFVRYSVKASTSTWDFDSGVEVETIPKGGEKYLKATVNYPESLSGVQIPIHLDSATAQAITHNSQNEAQIEVYSDEQLQNPVPFWIEYWNDNGALIWVKGNLPGTFYIKYNTGTYTRGDGSQVFLWFTDSDKRIDDGQSTSFDLSSYGIQGDIAIRFSMKPTTKNKAWNAGIRVHTEYTYKVRGRWYTDVYYINFTDDLVEEDNTLKIQDEWWDDYYGGWYSYYPTSVQKTRGCCGYRTYEVSIHPGYWDGDYPVADVDFADYGTTNRAYFDNPIRYNDDDGYYRVYKDPLLSLELINLDDNNDNTAVFDWVFIRRYVDISQLSEYVEIAGGQEPVSLQFIDDNPGHQDHGGDKLAILQDWDTNLDNYNGAWDVETPQRYEVIVEKDSINLDLTFTHSPNLAGSRESTASVQIGQVTGFKLFAIIDNGQGNDAYFDWIVAALYPYETYTESQITTTSSESVPSAGGYSTARAYDIQPFIDCIQAQKYFGVQGAPSFFERLEGGDTTNRNYYERIAAKMQMAVYGTARYPIGLVSFILPKDLPPNLNFLIRRQPAADYIYLNYRDYPSDNPNAKKVFGISTNGGVSSPLLDENFYLTPAIARKMFDVQGASDLLQG